MEAGVGAEAAEQAPPEGGGRGVIAGRPSILEPILGPSFPTVNALGPQGAGKVVFCKGVNLGTKNEPIFERLGP